MKESKALTGHKLICQIRRAAGKKATFDEVDLSNHYIIIQCWFESEDVFEWVKSKYPIVDWAAIDDDNEGLARIPRVFDRLGSETPNLKYNNFVMHFGFFGNKNETRAMKGMTQLDSHPAKATPETVEHTFKSLEI